MKKIKFKRITKIISVALLLLFVCISNAFITKGASPGTTEVGENEVSFDGEESLGYSYSLHVWLSKEKMGEACGAVYSGDFVYLCYELIEQSTGKPYSTFETNPISAHEVFKKNDGSVIYESTYDNDNNWIGIKVPEIESFTGTVEITGAITLEATVGCNVVIPNDTHMFCASAGGSEIKNAVLNSTCYYRYRLYDKNTNKNLFEVADKNDFKLTVEIKDPDGYRVLYDTPSVDEKNYSFKAGKVGKYTCVVTLSGKYTGSVTHELEIYKIDVTGVRLSSDKLEMIEGNIAYLQETVMPENASNKNVSWSSSNKSVATVDPYGKVTAKAPGTATIYVVTEDGSYTASCKVTVQSKTVKVTGVRLSSDKLEMIEGDTAFLKETVLPENASNKNVSWSSSNNSVATVDNNGKVTAKAPGTTIIYVVTEDGGFLDSCKVTVQSKTVKVTGVYLDTVDRSIYVGKSFYITATIKPDNATNKNLIWSSSDTRIISVDQYGKVTANAVGNATITACTEDGGYKAECRVAVTQMIIKVKKVLLNKTELNLCVGYSEKLKATFLPSDAVKEKIIWSSNNKGVAVVDATGKVTAKSPGTVAIRATTVDGKKTARCIVNVKSKPIKSDKTVKLTVPDEIEKVDMYRVYNPSSGEHLYTSSVSEIKTLVSAGWKNEGIAWKASVKSGTPVYRLYNPYSGDHHYTTSASEKNSLVNAGWRYEGIGWYSDDNKGVPLYRLYNPYATVGSHHYTTNASEKDALIRGGWKYEGIAWYGVR